jgi:hypothetical protein
MTKLTMKGASLNRDELIERVGIMLGWAKAAHERGNIAEMWIILQEIRWALEPMAEGRSGLPYGPGFGTEWHLDRLREQVRSRS